MLLEGINALVVCGGDGSLMGADIFHSEWLSLISTLQPVNGKITDEQVKRHGHLHIIGEVTQDKHQGQTTTQRL